MDGAYGNEEAGEIKREADEISKVLSNGGVSSGEAGDEEAIQQEHDIPDDDDVEK